MSHQDREAFEEWARSSGAAANDRGCDNFFSETMRISFQAWKAARDHYRPRQTVDEIAREVSEECRAEMKARERVASSRIAVGSDLHLIEMLLRSMDNLRAAFMEMQPKLTEAEVLERAAIAIFFQRKSRAFPGAAAPWETTTELTREIYLSDAKAALRAAGVKFSEEA